MITLKGPASIADHTRLVL